MSTIVTRAGKGAPLSNTEMDANFTNLNSDKYQSGDSPSFTNLSYTGTLTGGTGVVNLGSGQFYKDASGNVGIGTSSPRSVAGYTSLGINNTTGGLLDIFSSGTRVASFAADGSSLDIRAVASMPMVFSTNNTERMRIDASGNVGIGTSTITSGIKLQITGNTLIPLTNSYHCYTFDYGMGTPDSGGLQLFTATSDVMRFGQRSSGTFTERMRIDSAGNVGIGTNSPTNKVDILTADNTGLVVRSASYAGSFVPSTLIGGMAITTNGAYPLGFYINGAERMRIDSSGNVGIGTSSPASYGKLTVWGGNAFIQSTTASVGAKITLSDTNNSAYISSAPSGVVTGLAFGIGSTEAMRIDSSGNVGIGVTPNNASLSIYSGKNISFQWAANTYNYANIFNQSSSAALILASGYQWSATASGFASSVPVAWNKAAIALGGGITFYADNTTTVAVGTDQTPTPRMFIASGGSVGIGTLTPGVALDVVAAQGTIRATSSTGTNTSYLAVNNTGGFLYLGREDSTGAAFGLGAYSGIICSTGAYPLVTAVNGAERMRISSAGVVTMPNQPAFGIAFDNYGFSLVNTSAYIGTSSLSYNGYTILASSPNFNTATGVFTAPVAGKYYFTGHYTRSGGNARITLVKNGSSIGNGCVLLSYGADWQTATTSVVVSLSANDTVAAVIDAVNGTTTANYSCSFSGHLIG